MGWKESVQKRKPKIDDGVHIKMSLVCRELKFIKELEDFIYKELSAKDAMKVRTILQKRVDELAVTIHYNDEEREDDRYACNGATSITRYKITSNKDKVTCMNCRKILNRIKRMEDMMEETAP